MKLYEEFKLYETLWEDTDETTQGDVDKMFDDTDKFHFPKVHMWKLPDGREIEISSDEARLAEEKLFLEKQNLEGMYTSRDSIEVGNQLRIINSCLNTIDRNEQFWSYKNKSIIDKLKKYTNVADKADLDDILHQLNVASKNRDVIKAKNQIEKSSKILSELYASL